MAHANTVIHYMDGPLYANFCTSVIENNIIPNLEKPPILYLRGVDDILLLIHNFEQLYMLIFKRSLALPSAYLLKYYNLIYFIFI